MKTLVERKDQESVLAQWRGASAQFWVFNVSLKRLAIRIYRPREKEALYVTAVGCEHIIGPFTWEGADVVLEIEPPGAEIPTHARVVDKRAGFELHCSDARVFRGSSGEKIFEDFLG